MIIKNGIKLYGCQDVAVLIGINIINVRKYYKTFDIAKDIITIKRHNYITEESLKVFLERYLDKLLSARKSNN